MIKVDKIDLEKLFTDFKTSNEKETLEKIYSKYNKIVYSIAYSILKNKDDSEDIVQTVFSKLYILNKEKMPKENAASWLYQVTKNEAISFLRKKKNNIDLDSIYEIEDNNNEINNIIDQDSYSRLISNLNEREQEIISLKIISKFSFDEISKLLNEPTGTIKWRYYKSVHTIKILFSNLAMFILTFIIGLKAIFNKKIINKEQGTNYEVMDNVDSSTNNNEETDSSTSNQEQEDNLENIFNPENMGQPNINLTPNETIADKYTQIGQIQFSNINYVGIGFLGFSVIFLIITIIFTMFFTKYRLKGKKSKS